MPPPLVVGQLALEFRLIVEQQSLGRTQSQPLAEHDVDGFLAFKIRHIVEQNQHHDDEPSKLVVVVHLDIVARRLRLDQPRLLILGKLMVNAVLTPQRHLRALA